MARLDVAGIREFLQLPDPPDRVEVRELRRVDVGGYDRLQLDIACPDGDRMPAYLLLPHGHRNARPAPGVVVFHQHAAQWHLGKSEAAGLLGDPTQAFGPALARAGLVVLAPDAIAFEDRRRTTGGTEPHRDDEYQQRRELAYRLLHGQTLAAKVLADAEAAFTVLCQRPEVDPARVGVLGHSFGGNTVIFHAALDARVRFAATSGAAGSYRVKMANEIGIDRAEVIPGVLDRFEIDDLLCLIAPRPLGIFAGDDDRYALDVADLAAVTTQAYRDEGALDRLHVDIVPGGHALTPARHRAIVDWVVRSARAR